MHINLTKPRQIPDVLFYSPAKDCYRMLDIKRNAYIGEMTVEKRRELYIDSLNIKSSERRKGYGTKFLNFAKNLSKRMGLGGDMRLMAGPTTDGGGVPPHVFYRKYGFTSDDKEILNRVDNAIKTGEKLDIENAPIIYMYYKA